MIYFREEKTVSAQYIPVPKVSQFLTPTCRSPGRGGGGFMDSILSQNRVLTKDVKTWTCCCYVRLATLIVLRVVSVGWGGGDALVPNRCNALHARLRLPNKICAIKLLVACYSLDVSICLGL